MAAGYTSHLAAREALLLRAVDKGLYAAAYLYQAEMIDRLQYGYTSGDFVTPASSKHVTVGQPEWREGKRSIAIGMPGSADGTDYMYVLYWELGHLSLWSADYEHVPVWVPTLEELAPRLRAAFAEAFHGVFGSGVAQ